MAVYRGDHDAELPHVAYCHWRGNDQRALISVVLGMYGGPLIGGVMLAMTGAGVFIGTALLSLLLCVIIYACRNNMMVRLQDS
jgi:hypothetical protein